MIEPISIAAASGTLISSCRTLLNYINRVSSVDSVINVLALEIDSLSRVLLSIHTSFSDPSLTSIAAQTGHEGTHWKNVSRLLKYCTRTLEILTDILEGVQVQKGGFLRRPRALYKLEDKAGEITSLRQQITNYCQTMLLSLQVLSLYVFIITWFRTY